MVICLERGANDLHMIQLLPLPAHRLCIRKIQNYLSFRYRPSRVVVEKWLSNKCSCCCFAVFFYPCRGLHMTCTCFSSVAVCHGVYLSLILGHWTPVISSACGGYLGLIAMIVPLITVLQCIATATPSSLLQQNPEWFILLVSTHPGSHKGS